LINPDAAPRRQLPMINARQDVLFQVLPALGAKEPQARSKRGCVELQVAARDDDTPPPGIDVEKATAAACGYDDGLRAGRCPPHDRAVARSTQHVLSERRHDVVPL